MTISTHILIYIVNNISIIKKCVWVLYQDLLYTQIHTDTGCLDYTPLKVNDKASDYTCNTECNNRLITNMNKPLEVFNSPEICSDSVITIQISFMVLILYNYIRLF